MYYYTRKFFTSKTVSLFNYSDGSNPKVFLDVSKGGKSLGKMVFEVSFTV